MIERQVVRLRRPGRLGLLGIAVSLVVVAAIAERVIVSRWVRPFVAEQVSAQIAGRATIGGLDVSLFGASATVDDFAVVPRATTSEPLVKAKRITVRLSRRALLRGEIHVAEIGIDRPQITLERLPTGEWGLLHLLAAPEPTVGPTAALADGATPAATDTPTPTATATPTPDGSPVPSRPILIDRVRIRDGRIEVSDLMHPEKVTFDIPIARADADHLILSGDADDTPLAFHLAARVEGADVALDGSFRRKGDEPGLALDVGIERLPFERARLYIPEFGWQKLTGTLDTTLHYVHDAGVRQVLSGTATVHDLQVAIGDGGEPALVAKELAVAIDSFDVLARRLALSSVKLTGLWLLVDVAPTPGLPLLPREWPPASPPDPSVPPFVWRLAHAELIDSTIHARVHGREVPVTVAATVDGIAGDGAAPSTITVGGRGRGRHGRDRREARPHAVRLRRHGDGHEPAAPARRRSRGRLGSRRAHAGHGDRRGRPQVRSGGPVRRGAGSGTHRRPSPRRSRPR